MELSEAHIKNLEILSDYLISNNLKKKFSMDDFCIDPYDYQSLVSPKKHRCGTIACAIGNGPDAGIEAGDAITWQQYSDNSFGIHVSSNFWLFMFGALWSDFDNTAVGAGHRIKFFLENIKEDEMYFYEILETRMKYFSEGWWEKQNG